MVIGNELTRGCIIFLGHQEFKKAGVERLLAEGSVAIQSADIAQLGNLSANP